MNKVKIGRRRIGDGEPCFIIAEAGSNHDQKLDQAFRLIDVAVEAGADAVKFQTFRAARLYPRNGGSVDYLKSLGLNQPVFDLVKSMEMPAPWIPKLATHCAKKGILFLSTPFDEESADWLDPFMPAFKIASYEMTHIPLIQHVAKKKKPLIVSTGAATMEEVGETVAAVRKTGNRSLCLMQCTAKYPAPFNSLNLRSIVTMKKRWGLPVGLSDHSRDAWLAPVAAVTLGANLIEKHFTLSNQLSGPDHSFAVEPDELKELVRRVRDAEQALGNGLKVPDRVETELREYRRGPFTVEPIMKGNPLNRTNTAVLRRAGLKESNISPKDYPKILGRKVRRNLPAFTQLKLNDIEFS